MAKAAEERRKALRDTLIDLAEVEIEENGIAAI